MNVILTSSSVPITLVADDLHWADDASIEVLYQILKQCHNNLLFVACCRDDKVFDDHKFWTLAKNAHGLGIHVNTIKLDVIEKDALNQAFCDMMRLLPRQVSSLTDIVYRRTKGNLLYIHQLLTSLSRGLIHIDVEEKRYSWDEAEILSLELPDDVAACFSNGISELSIEVQTSLHILSMLGTAPAEYLEFLEGSLNLKLLESLQEAEMEGLVSNIKSVFQFLHDIIQEACYNLVDHQDRCRNHLMCGKLFMSMYFDTNNEDTLFMAVDQINRGSSSSPDINENYLLADYNITAGKKAMAMADFALACRLFNHAITLRGRNPSFYDQWGNESHYYVSLELHELAAKCHLAIGDINCIEALADQVMKYSKCFEDQLAMHCIVIDSLAYTSKIKESLHAHSLHLS